eukprot:703266-Prymnesium_polylepis.1
MSSNLGEILPVFVRRVGAKKGITHALPIHDRRRDRPDAIRVAFGLQVLHAGRHVARHGHGQKGIARLDQLVEMRLLKHPALDHHARPEGRPAVVVCHVRLVQEPVREYARHRQRVVPHAKADHARKPTIWAMLIVRDIPAARHVDGLLGSTRGRLLGQVAVEPQTPGRHRLPPREVWPRDDDIIVRPPLPALSTPDEVVASLAGMQLREKAGLVGLGLLALLGRRLVSKRPVARAVRRRRRRGGHNLGVFRGHAEPPQRAFDAISLRVRLAPRVVLAALVLQLEIRDHVNVGTTRASEEVRLDALGDERVAERARAAAEAHSDGGRLTAGSGAEEPRKVDRLSRCCSL